jgi:preprotein translocase subunit SecG
MSLSFSVLLAIHIVLAILLVAIILIQQGSGATAGANFGGGASSTVFGSRGSGSFLTRTTAILATFFLTNSLLLGYLYGQALEPTSLLDQISAPTQQVSAPLVPTDVPDAAGAVDDVPTLPAQ